MGTRNGMTVAELIERLQEMPEDAQVHFAYDYGDHWHSQVAPGVREVDQVRVKWSEYHRMDQVAKDQDEDDEDEQEKPEDKRSREVVVIS